MKAFFHFWFCFYVTVLWYSGFIDHDGKLVYINPHIEFITNMLRRAKVRLGIFWWLITAGIKTLLMWQIWAVRDYWIGIPAFCDWWLTWHICQAPAPPPDQLRLRDVWTRFQV